MKITVVCVGKLKEKFFADGVEEYKKRLGRYAKIEIAEVADEKAPENLSIAEEEQVKAKEGEKILKKIPDDAFVVIVGSLYVFTRKDGNTVTVTVDGKFFGEYSLNEDRIVEIRVGECFNLLLIEGGKDCLWRIGT